MGAAGLGGATEPHVNAVTHSTSPTLPPGQEWERPGLQNKPLRCPGNEAHAQTPTPASRPATDHLSPLRVRPRRAGTAIPIDSRCQELRLRGSLQSMHMGAGLELLTLLPPSECWGHRCEPPP